MSKHMYLNWFFKCQVLLLLELKLFTQNTWILQNKKKEFVLFVFCRVPYSKLNFNSPTTDAQEQKFKRLKFGKP